MEQDLLQKDGNYNRLGFLLSNDGILIPFGYRNFFDFINALSKKAFIKISKIMFEITI